jgi:hypothetical protein
MRTLGRRGGAFIEKFPWLPSSSAMDILATRESLNESQDVYKNQR